MKKNDWECVEPGWYVNEKLDVGVCQERNKKWYVYIKNEVVRNGFTSLKEAMEYAEKFEYNEWSQE
jgi:hypothetical protein